MFITIKPIQMETIFSDEDIRNVISNIIKDIVYGNIDDYFNEQNMPIWVSSVTNETIDNKNNYRILRYFGTYILDTNFSIYCTKAYGNLEEGDYTDMVREFLVEPHFQDMSVKLGLSKLIRTIPEITEGIQNIESNLYLSFYAALFYVSENVNPGTGHSICFNMVNKLYRTREIEIEYFGKPPTTRFIQLFNKYGTKIKLENYITYQKDGSFDIRLPEEIARAAEIEDPFLGNYLNISIADAFRQVLSILDQRGILSRLEDSSKKKSRTAIVSRDVRPDRNWLKKIDSTITNILRKILPPGTDSSFINQFFTKNAMATWTKCFTDPSYDSKDNYDVLEFVGDRILNSLFLLHCKSLYPTLERMDYSNLLHSYQKKERQKKITIDLKLDLLLRSDPNIKRDGRLLDKLQSDIFEAFVGGLYEVGNKMTNGIGIELCRNLVSYLYPEIDLNLSRPPYTTIFTQIFQKLSLPNTKKDYLSINEKGEHIITLPPVVVTFLVSNGVEISSVDQNGRYYVGRYSNVNQEQAFQNALRDMKQKLSIDTEWSLSIKDNIDFDVIEKDLKSQTFQLAKRLGYKRLYIERPNRENSYYLYAEKGDSDYLLSTAKINNKYGEDPRTIAFPMLVRNFISMNSSDS